MAVPQANRPLPEIMQDLLQAEADAVKRRDYVDAARIKDRIDELQLQQSTEQTDRESSVHNAQLAELVDIQQVVQDPVSQVQGNAKRFDQESSQYCVHEGGPVSKQRVRKESEAKGDEAAVPQLPSLSEMDAKTPAERRAARKAAAPPALDLTMQMQDIMNGNFSEGLTAAREAEEVCKIIEAKADVLATDGSTGGDGNTPLMFCAQRAASSEILQSLLKAKADPLVTNARGFNVLHSFAARRSDAASPEMLRVLLDSGASSLLQRKSSNGLTPLHVAAAWLDADMCSLLIKASANPSAKEDGIGTPLEWASKRKPNNYQLAALEAVLLS